jgi:hypothetical protein
VKEENMSTETEGVTLRHKLEDVDGALADGAALLRVLHRCMGTGDDLDPDDVFVVIGHALDFLNKADRDLDVATTAMPEDVKNAVLEKVL